MKIDTFNHIMPPAFIDRLETFAPPFLIKVIRAIPTIHDVDARLRHVEPFNDYQQILAAGNPVIDDWAGPEDTPALARLVNDEMAKIAAAHPDRFPGYIATLPMNNPDAALAEIERAVYNGGASGIQIYTNVAGRPLDEPEFYPIFERMAQLDKAIWLHPIRGPNFADYRTEESSKFDVWWGLGWPYETSAAMARIVFSDVFEKLPDLKVVAHHWGAYIPHAEGRLGPNWERGMMVSDTFDGEPLWHNKSRSLLDSFKLFYGDTAMFGAKAASQCGLDFFGADHSTFATDYPFDYEHGMRNLQLTIEVVDSLRCTEEERHMVYEEIPRMLLG